MNEEIQNSESVVESENLQEATAESTPQEETAVAQSVENTVKDEDRNFAALRRAKEAAERERDAYYKKLQESSQQEPEKKNKEPELGDDDLARS